VVGELYGRITWSKDIIFRRDIEFRVLKLRSHIMGIMIKRYKELFFCVFLFIFLPTLVKCGPLLAALPMISEGAKLLGGGGSKSPPHENSKLTTLPQPSIQIVSIGDPNQLANRYMPKSKYSVSPPPRDPPINIHVEPEPSEDKINIHIPNIKRISRKNVRKGRIWTSLIDVRDREVRHLRPVQEVHHHYYSEPDPVIGFGQMRAQNMGPFMARPRNLMARTPKNLYGGDYGHRFGYGYEHIDDGGRVVVSPGSAPHIVSPLIYHGYQPEYPLYIV
jgi:hypothetical protein